MERRLYRSRDDRMIWGVCGGLADYFNLDPVIVRIIFVVFIFIGGFAVPAYIILAIVVPLETSKATTTGEAVKENIEEIKTTASELSRELQTTFDKDTGNKEERKVQYRRHYWLGIILIIIGILFLLNTFIDWLSWSRLWPVILIVIGLLVILFRRRRD